VVSLDADGTIVAGEPARRRLLTQPERTIYSVKRLMGRGLADVQEELKLFPFRVDPESQQVIRVRLGERVFTPPEISAFILRELKNWAEHCWEPQMVGSRPAICLRVIKPNVPHEGQESTAQ
jgi:molecular chaperone DnaK (HSP70)